jgi:tetratricopeptide (TPR) repeat protein
MVMKKSLLVLAAMTVCIVIAMGAFAQDKTVKTTTDSRGFETRHTEVDLWFQTAKEFINAAQYDKAAVELEKVMAADVNRLDALHELGQCYQKLNAWDKAAVAYSKAAEAHPDDQRLLVNLGYYQMRAKDVDGAKATYQKILDADPDNYDGNRWLAYLYEKTGDNENALKYYTAALEAKPDDVKTIGSLASIYSDMGQKDKALEMYELAISAADDELAPKLKSQLGTMYIESGDFAKAAPLFAELVELFPDKSAYRYNLGISFNQLKRYDRGAPELAKAVELKPEFCAAYAQLANAYNELKKSGDAMKTAKAGAGVCADKKKPALYYEWGRSLEGLGRYEEAIEMFARVEDDPTWGGAAKKQIQRQQDLIRRAEVIREQSGY